MKWFSFLLSSLLSAIAMATLASTLNADQRNESQQMDGAGEKNFAEVLGRPVRVASIVPGIEVVEYMAEMDNSHLIDVDYEPDVDFPADVLISYTKNWSTVIEDTMSDLQPVLKTLPTDERIPLHGLYLTSQPGSRPIIVVFVNLSYYADSSMITALCEIATFTMNNIIYYQREFSPGIVHGNC